jgi:bifunctional non-homologous end joining protein LigD
MLASPAAALPSGPEWSYEVKLDGYRALAILDAGRVTLRSRNLRNLTATYPAVVTGLGQLRASSAVLDGEIVALDDRGTPSFQALQHGRTARIVYYAFDLLHLDGRDLTAWPLSRRRDALSTLIAGTPVLLSEELPGTPARIEQAVRELGLEGVVAKRRDSPYIPGARSAAWIKVRFNRRQEFVVGGYRPSGRTFDSILVGYYDQKQQLCFVAKVRAGFRPVSRTALFAALHPMARCPFANLPQQGRGRWGEGIGPEDMTELRWVRPALVVEVAFVEWTDAGMLRHPAFVGIRTDKAPSDVRRE